MALPKGSSSIPLQLLDFSGYIGSHDGRLASLPYNAFEHHQHRELIRFKYEFLSAAQGKLEFLFDDATVLEAEEAYSLGVEESGWLVLGDPVALSQHYLEFMLFPQTTNQSTAGRTEVSALR